MTVDTQLERLEDVLRMELNFQLTVHTSYQYWEQFDAMDNETWENINATIRDVFSTLIRMYGYTPAVPILQNCRNMLIHVVWAAINVPYPRNPFDHIISVIDNTINVYIRTTYAPLRTEMIVANHFAQVIQRTWRHVISNPAYAMCRSRLLNEFKKISS
jgi:hypothetical protein